MALALGIFLSIFAFGLRGVQVSDAPLSSLAVASLSSACAASPPLDAPSPACSMRRRRRPGQPAIAHPGRAGASAPDNAAAATAQAAAPAGFVCPETMTCRAKPDPDSAAAWISYLHHLHAGEEFGPTGTILSIARGLALLFFAFSGLWMYIEMFRGRRAAAQAIRKRIFWK